MRENDAEAAAPEQAPLEGDAIERSESHDYPGAFAPPTATSALSEFRAEAVEAAMALAERTATENTPSPARQRAVGRPRKPPERRSATSSYLIRQA